MQFQKQLFGEPDKKVFCQKMFIEKFVRDIGHSVFDSRIGKWFIAIDTKIAKGKGSKMGLTEDLTVDDTGPNDWVLQGLILGGGMAQFIGQDLMNNRAIEIIEVKENILVIRGFGLTWAGQKKMVFFNDETDKWEVGIE